MRVDARGLARDGRRVALESDFQCIHRSIGIESCVGRHAARHDILRFQVSCADGFPRWEARAIWPLIAPESVLPTRVLKSLN